MLDDIDAIPTHALLVHAVVVLLPLAALGGIAVVVVPALRRRYGGLVLLRTIGAVAAVPLTRKSGGGSSTGCRPSSGRAMWPTSARGGSRAAWERLSQRASMAPLGC